MPDVLRHSGTTGKIALAPSGKSVASIRASRPRLEGRIAIVMKRGPDCGGREMPVDERHAADGEVAWSRRRGAGAKSAMMFCITPATGARKPFPEESAI